MQKTGLFQKRGKYFLGGFPGFTSGQRICLKFTSAMGIHSMPFNDVNLALIHGSDVNQCPIHIEQVNQTKNSIGYGF